MEIHRHTLRNTRISISAFFFFFGFIFATWASRIPAIQQALHLSDAQLGGVLLALPVGSFITLPFSGYFTSNYGSKKIIIISSLSYVALLAAIGFSVNIFLLTAVLFLFGSASNLLNIAINTQAIALEVLYKKTIISSFHGMWSVAGLAAAGLGTWFIAKAFPVANHFLLVAGLSLAGCILSFPFLLAENKASQEKRPFFTKPDRAFLALGLIAFSSLICQGAMFDWSGVYFKKLVTSDKAFIGFGYTAFMISMTGIRFITDWITNHIGFKKIIILCGFFITAGLSLAVWLPYLLPATIGMFLVGIGVSPTVPLVFSAAGKSRKMPPPVAIAAVSSIGMIGLLIGPPMIGFISGLSSLKISFLVLSAFGLGIIITALLIRQDA